jgi:hypothetical protein
VPAAPCWPPRARGSRDFSTDRSNGTNKVIDTQGTFLLCSPVYIELQPRQSLVPGFAPVSICPPLPFNSLRIRTYNYVLPQPLYNPHLRSPLGCVGNKGLTGTRVHRQLFCNQHLRTPLRSAGNTGLITLLESALTKNAPATLLESALTKSRGEGGNMVILTRRRLTLLRVVHSLGVGARPPRRESSARFEATHLTRPASLPSMAAARGCALLRRGAISP